MFSRNIDGCYQGIKIVSGSTKLGRGGSILLSSGNGDAAGNIDIIGGISNDPSSVGSEIGISIGQSSGMGGSIVLEAGSSRSATGGMVSISVEPAVKWEGGQ